MKSESSAEDLAASRDQRFQRIKADRIESLLTYLKFARRLREANRQSCDRIDDLIRSTEDELADVRSALGGRISPRLRPDRERRSSDSYLLFVDECGNHALNAKEPFRTFCLSGVLVKEGDYAAFDGLWKKWKADNLGAQSTIVHEPDLRKGRKSFWCDGDKAKRMAAHTSLESFVPTLPYIGFACVLDRDAYVAEVGDDSLDSSLPQHTYLMTVNFLAERVALALENELGGAKARWIIESRGAKEDAAFQFEFARLFLDGTSYLAPHYFRHVFRPGLEFEDKDSNSSGLQIADLQARPCAEKVMAPESDPPRWRAFRSQLCRGAYTAHSILGMKIMPWHPKYDRLWES